MARVIKRMSAEIIYEYDDEVLDPDRTDRYMHSAESNAFRNVDGVEVSVIIYRDGKRISGHVPSDSASQEHQDVVKGILFGHEGERPKAVS